MTEQDQADKDAAEMLPCRWVTEHGADPCASNRISCDICAVRPAVAARLRELYDHVADLKEQIAQLQDELQQGPIF